MLYGNGCSHAPCGGRGGVIHPILYGKVRQGAKSAAAGLLPPLLRRGRSDARKVSNGCMHPREARGHGKVHQGGSEEESYTPRCHPRVRSCYWSW